MCNIAGYIGRKQAAPILLEMMSREEGYAGGFYTGITVHDGNHLVSEKVIGGLDHLLAETPCRSLLGTCGFIHSRSKSGGDREWAQPFLSADRKTSLIANGGAGVFLTEAQKEKRCRVAMMLSDRGYTFGTRTRGVIGNYPALADGTAIHSTDLMAQYATYLIDGGVAPADALTGTMRELPCEAVVLMMREECPDSIFITRINYPMTVGLAKDGDVYFATTRLAFPDDVDFESIYLLPAMQTYEATRGRVLHSSSLDLDARVAEITPELAERAFAAFMAKLAESEGPLMAVPLISSYSGIWPKGEIPQDEPLFYTLVERLRDEGRLAVTAIPVEGAADGITAHKFAVSVKKNT